MTEPAPTVIGGVPEPRGTQPPAAPPGVPGPLPDLEIGGPAAPAWREIALTRAVELHSLTLQFAAAREDAGARYAAAAIEAHLAAARSAAAREFTRWRWPAVRRWVTASDVERTWNNLDAAEAHLLRMAPMSFLRGQLPGVQAHVRRHLPPNDPRRSYVEAVVKATVDRELTDVERDGVVGAFRGAASAARREVMRVRSFHNVLLVAAVLLTIFTIGLAALGFFLPRTLPMCFAPPSGVVCPSGGAAATRWDLMLIEFVGLVAAAVSGAAALKRVRGTATPFGLPAALAVLKLPTGALTAVLGLLLMRGQFVPGLSALDSAEQIVAWAVVFGYAQQLLTRLVDQRAQQVLDDVRGHVPPDQSPRASR